jgi:hypothetical protein
MTDIDTLRETEKRLRAVDSSSHGALRKAKRELENVRGDDRDAYAVALLAGDTLPKPRAVKLHEQIRDYEVRVIPGIDQALWLFARQVREAIRPNLDPATHRQLDTQLKRWQPPDAHDLSTPAPTQHLDRRPDDIVQWVADGIRNLEQFISEHEAKAEKDRRQKAAQARVNQAQAEHNRIEGKRVGEWVEAHPHSNLPSGWPVPFNRAKFLEDEDLMDDYGYVKPRGG